MKHRHILLLALGVVGCGSTQEPVRPPISQGTFQVESPVAAKHPGLEITIPVAQIAHTTYTQTRTFFAWRPVSENVAPKLVRWILLDASEFGNDFEATLAHIQSHPDDPRWTDWITYKRASGQGASWYSPPVSDGRYVFALQGRATNGTTDDEFDPERNVRFLQVDHSYEHGPLVRLSGTFFDPFESTGLAPIAIANVPAGASLQFAWSADASHLETDIATYRYGWDIVDPYNDSFWEVAPTQYDGSCVSSPSKIFHFGTHTFTVEVKDNEGNRTWVSAKVNVEQAESFNGAFDITPGDCGNPLNVRSRGQFVAVLAGTPPYEDLEGFDATTVDIQTVLLGGLKGVAVAPVDAYFADLVTTGTPGYCQCLDAIPDGRLDLVLTFETEDLVAGLDPAPSSNSSRLLWCFGERDHPNWGRVPFRTADCVNFVGLPGPAQGCHLTAKTSTDQEGTRPRADAR